MLQFSIETCTFVDDIALASSLTAIARFKMDCILTSVVFGMATVTGPILGFIVFFFIKWSRYTVMLRGYIITNDVCCY